MNLQLNALASAIGAKPILVVDDDADVRETLSMFLESEGFLVATVSNGTEALKRLKAGMRPGVILLDVMMPGMTGLEVLEEVMSDDALAEIPVTIMSGSHRLDPSDRADFLQKPIRPDELLRVVHAHLPEASAYSAPPQ
ncbi:MAG: response regulator [Polyangiaceae bacterium]|nr:response regulator [Polyangiaceae bacterium]